MKLYVINTSRHSERDVAWLVRFGYKHVRKVAEQEGWGDQFNSRPIALRVTHTWHGYCGRYLGSHYASQIRGFAYQKHGLLANDLVRNVLTRVGKASNFPCNSTYARFDNMPPARLESWEEAVVGLTAHELGHIHYNYSNGKRRAAEVACESIEAGCLEAFRRPEVQAEFAAFRAEQAQRVAAKQERTAAKRAPAIRLDDKIARAEAKLAMWQRKLKAAANKVKKYTRIVNRLKNKQQKENQ